MIRPMLLQIILFLIPFALYALFLAATRTKVLDLDRWSLHTVAWLTIASFTLMIGSFLVLAQFSGAPAGSPYVPAQVEDGRVVPGTGR